MNLLDTHSEAIKRNVAAFGRPVILSDGVNSFPLTAIWNEVDHAIKLENVTGDPMGAKSSLYIDRDSLQTETGEIKPAEGWTAFGSPNKYDAEKIYIIHIPKQDKQLPGVLLFLSEENPGATGWTQIDEATL